MALVSDGFYLTVTLMDSGLNTSTLNFDLVAADHATAVTDSATVIAALSAVTQAEIKAYSISNRFYEDNISVPIAGIQIENQALVVVQLASSPLKKASIRIPAPSPDIFLALTGEGSNTVDVLNAELVDYVDIWQETGGIATLSDGEAINDGLAAILRGRRVHRASNKG